MLIECKRFVQKDKKETKTYQEVFSLSEKLHKHLNEPEVYQKIKINSNFFKNFI